MKVKPFSEEQIWSAINTGWERMTPAQRRLWEVIRISPEKWQQHPYGDQGGAFWVVGIIGSSIVWYNDIEEGFNRSLFTKYGEIGEYWCNQDELELTIQRIIDEITDGYQDDGKASPPQSIP